MIRLPAGYEGIITKNRGISWLNRLWAISDSYYPTFDRRLPMTASIKDAIAQVNTDQTGLNWYDRATANAWNVVSDSCQIICLPGFERVDNNTCRRISSESDINGGNQEEGVWSVDTDGDGITDRLISDPDSKYEQRGGAVRIGTQIGPDIRTEQDKLEAEDNPGNNRGSGIGQALSNLFNNIGNFFENVFNGGNEEKEEEEEEEEESSGGGGGLDR